MKKKKSLTIFFVTVVCGIVFAVGLSGFLSLSVSNSHFRTHATVARSTRGPAVAHLGRMSHSAFVSVDWWHLGWPTPECSMVGHFRGQSDWALAHPGDREVTQCSLRVGPSWCAFFPFGKRKKTRWYLNICKAIFQFPFFFFLTFFPFPKYSLFPSLEFLSP